MIGSNLMPMREFRRELNDKMKEYNVDPSFARRYLNDGFSGGEKKRTEVLQMAMLEPKFAILDESDSGLDIDALRVVSDGINKLATPDRGFLLITHYQRMLELCQAGLCEHFLQRAHRHDRRAGSGPHAGRTRLRLGGRRVWRERQHGFTTTGCDLRIWLVNETSCTSEIDSIVIRRRRAHMATQTDHATTDRRQGRISVRLS